MPSARLILLPLLLVAFAMSTATLVLCARDINKTLHVLHQLKVTGLDKFLQIDFHDFKGVEVFTMILAGATVVPSLFFLIVNALFLKSGSQAIYGRVKYQGALFALLSVAWIIAMGLFTYIVHNRMFSFAKGPDFQNIAQVPITVFLATIKELDPQMAEALLKQFAGSTGTDALQAGIALLSHPDSLLALVNGFLSKEKYYQFDKFDRNVGTGWATFVFVLLAAIVAFVFPADSNTSFSNDSQPATLSPLEEKEMTEQA